MISSLTQYLQGVESNAARAQVRALARKSIGVNLSKLNHAKRIVVHDAIFAVENDIESRAGGQADHATVKQLNAARNLVLDDLGWNQSQDSFQLPKTVSRIAFSKAA